MSAAPPPQRVNIRKAVTHGATYEGSLGASELERFDDVLSDGARVVVRAHFGRDEENRQIVDLKLSATVALVCQRCLDLMQVPIASESRLGLVMTDEQAQGLPRAYEPWIAVDEVDLWAMAREELALALPAVAYHEPGLCSAPANPAAEVPASGNEELGKQNPFNVLSELLSDDEKQEI